MTLCKICGEDNCKKHNFLIGRSLNITQFSGSSPPEIFVGRWNYPNVYAGILSPQEYGDTKDLSSPESWHDKKMKIADILAMRQQLIYGRAQANIKQLNENFIPVMQEVAMTHKSISTEFKLKKAVHANKEHDQKVPLISNAGEIEKVRLEENASVKPKVEYLVNDNQLKSALAIQELSKASIDTSAIIKILSAGLLGLKANRKLVPTRWAITAVDDTLSKQKLEKIKTYPEIQDINVFTAEYLGNHYEFLLLPGNFSFEVIEMSQTNFGVWHDYETFEGRKAYAKDVTGAYYANRLALTEYLERIKRQGVCIVFREVRPEYYAPLGVGILRETSREAFSTQPKKFNTVKEALADIGTRIKILLHHYIGISVLLANYGKQKKLSQFF